MGTFQHLLDQYLGLLHQRAAYQAAADVLRKYTRSDLGPPRYHIEVGPPFCTSVPEDAVAQVIEELEHMVRKLDMEVHCFGESGIGARSLQGGRSR